MGGCAYFIHGEPNEEAKAPHPLKRNIVDRLLSRQRYSSPESTSFGNSTQIDLPADNIQMLSDEFRAYIRKQLGTPNEATQMIINYLDDGMIDIYLRGEIQDVSEDERWYVQVTFSGCAGMADVTAELCSHWAGIWCEEEHDRIFSKILTPAGFNPLDSNMPEQTFPPFVPTEYGYAIYRECLGEYDEYHFEIDPCFLEGDDADEILLRLQNTHMESMKNGVCKCQLCELKKLS